MDRDFSEQRDAAVDAEGDFNLPDPREVNRRLREERQRIAAASQLAAKGVGAHRKLFELACERFSGDPARQIAYYLEHCTLHAATGRRRQVSEKTRTGYGEMLKQLPLLLKLLRKPIQDARQLGRTHVFAVMRYWEGMGHSEGTVQWRLSNLRRFFTYIGKPQVMPVGAEWRSIVQAQGIETGVRGRSQVATEAKGWRDQGLDAEAWIEDIRVKHPIVASQLDMCLWFGLRRNEAIQLQPARSDRKTHLLVDLGTKGGKSRTVEFSPNPETARKQREVLDRAKRLAGGNKRGILTIPGMTLQQMGSHVNYVLRKFNLTRNGLGVTQHGLRHQFGCDLFRDLSTLPAPALGTVPAYVYEENADLVAAAQKGVSIQMGHERASITSAYAGSVPGLQKDSTRRLKERLDRAAEAGDALRELEVEDAWIVGRAGEGVRLADGEAVHICLRVPASALKPDTLADALGRARSVLEDKLGQPVVVTLNVDGARPADGAEILFNA